jgi:hypothetical protein
MALLAVDGCSALVDVRCSFYFGGKTVEHAVRSRLARLSEGLDSKPAARFRQEKKRDPRINARPPVTRRASARTQRSAVGPTNRPLPRRRRQDRDHARMAAGPPRFAAMATHCGPGTVESGIEVAAFTGDELLQACAISDDGRSVGALTQSAAMQILRVEIPSRSGPTRPHDGNPPLTPMLGMARV